jgi:hypothetical protein
MSATDEYIKIYTNAISDYIRALEKADFLRERRDLIAIGFRALTHVFNMNLLNSGNLEIAYYSSQKAHIYYIEYLSQTKYDLNPANAVLFIYNKTLGTYIGGKQCSFNPRIAKIAELVYWWDNPNINQSQLPKSLITDCLSSSNPNLFFYLETVQKREWTSHDEYIQVLPKLLSLRKSQFALRDVDESEPYNLWVAKIVDA